MDRSFLEIQDTSPDDDTDFVPKQQPSHRVGNRSFGLSGSVSVYTRYDQTYVRDLTAGDEVMTFPYGFQEIQHIERHVLSGEQTGIVSLSSPDFGPLIGHVYVNRLQRLLIRDNTELRYLFGKSEVLIHAEDLGISLGGYHVDLGPTSYYEVVLSRSAMLWSVHGLMECPTSDLSSGSEVGFASLSEEQRAIWRALNPQLATTTGYRLWGES